MEKYWELWNKAVQESIPDEAWERHYELCKEHGIDCYPPPDNTPIWNGEAWENDLRFEDRETRIASGEEVWQSND